MSMSEIVSFLDLSVFPSIALVFFLAAFIGVIWWVMTRPRKEIDDAASIVLHEDRVITPRTPSRSDGGKRDTRDTNDRPQPGKGSSHG